LKKLVLCGSAALSLLAVGCGGGDTAGDSGACDASFPDPPKGATNVVYASASCPASSADGSQDHPFATITDAVTAGGKGATILVAKGTYGENLALTSDVTIIGAATAGMHGGDAGIILQAPAGDAVRVSNGANVSLTGFDIEGAKSVGILAIGGSATISASKVVGTVEDASQPGVAYGVSAATEGAIILQDSAVTGSALIGVYFVSATGTVSSSDISNNAGGGVRFDSSEEGTLEGNTLTSNSGFGVAVFGSVGIILQDNQISGTALAPIAPGSSEQMGDGLVVGQATGETGSSITASGNTIDGSGRVGILAAAGAHGIILQDNTVTSSAATIGFGAGIWLQEGAGADASSEISRNKVGANRFVGIGLSGDTHGIILQSNVVTNTTMGTFFAGGQQGSIGDGLNVLAGASANITGNTVSGNARLGLILDQADGANTALSGNTVSDNAQGAIILQDQSGTAPTLDAAAQAEAMPASAGTWSLNSEAFAAE
jgi:parallel beta-helix repeat protein